MIIDELMECVRGIDADALDEDTVCGILDSREEDPFDSEWCRADEAVEKLKTPGNYTAVHQAEHERVCKEAFFLIADGESELCDYVSDDFGLLYDAMVLGYTDDFLDRMTAAYREGRIPCGDDLD